MFLESLCCDGDLGLHQVVHFQGFQLLDGLSHELYLKCIIRILGQSIQRECQSAAKTLPTLAALPCSPASEANSLPHLPLSAVRKKGKTSPANGKGLPMVGAAAERTADCLCEFGLRGPAIFLLEWEAHYQMPNKGQSVQLLCSEGSEANAKGSDYCGQQAAFRSNALRFEVDCGMPQKSLIFTTQTPFYNQLIGYSMKQKEAFISISNSRTDLNTITNGPRREFVQYLIKAFNPRLSSHHSQLKNASSKLADFDSSLNRKETFLVSTTSRFHYFQRSDLRLHNINLYKKVYDDSFFALNQTLHFRFAEVLAKEVGNKIVELYKNSDDTLQEFRNSHRVLADTGSLLEVDYKIVYAQLDLNAKWRNEKYLRSEEEDSFENPKNEIQFISIFFGISAVYIPPVKDEDIRIEEKKNQMKISRKDLEYIQLKQDLMKFIGAKRSNNYYLVFHKFHLLHLKQFETYREKYLVRQAVKEGFFGSIGNFFKSAASTVANGIGKAASVANNAIDFYNQTIRPVANVLTPIIAPLLPDSVGQLLKKVTSTQSAEIDPALEKRIQIQALELHKKDKEKFEKDKIPLPDIEEYKILVRQKQSLKKNFNLVLDKTKDYNQNLKINAKKLFQTLQARIGTVKLTKQKQTKFYTGLLLQDNVTILTHLFQTPDDKIEFSFSLDNGPSYPVKPRKYAKDVSLLRLKQIPSQLMKSKDQLQFKFELDFKEDYSSEECFYESLINKNIFLAGKPKGKDKVDIQVSKVLKSFRTSFLDLFDKKEDYLGGPIFYIDEKQNVCKIIATCNSKEQLTSVLEPPSQKKDNKQAKSDKSANNEQNKQFFGFNSSLISTAINFATKFLNKQSIASEFSSPVKDKQAGFIQFDTEGPKLLVDKNLNGQALRTQLINKEFRLSSPFDRVGIVVMSSDDETKYGTGVLYDEKYFITLKENVLYEGFGNIYIKKSYDNKDKPQAFTLLNLQDEEEFYQYQVSNIVPYEQSDDYVILEVFQDEENVEKIKENQRKLNLMKSDNIKNINETGAFVVGFDFSSILSNLSVTLQYRQLTATDQTTLKFNKSAPNFQGIIFGYDKQTPKNEYFTGFYRPKTNSFIFPPVIDKKEGESERIIFTTDTIKKKTPVSTLQVMKEVNKELGNYSAVGCFAFNGANAGFGTGTIVQANPGNIQRVITCGHNFYNFQRGIIRDWRNAAAVGIQFRYNYRKQGNRQIYNVANITGVTIHPNYLNINQHKHNPLVLLHPGLLLTNEECYDIAVVQLGLNVVIARPIQLNLATIIDGNLQNNLNTLTNNFLRNDYRIGIEVVGFPSLIATKFLTIKNGRMYRQYVLLHRRRLGYPQDFFTVQNNTGVDNSTRLIRHKLSTLLGHSGSPIYNTTTREIIGVHVAGLNESDHIVLSQYGTINFGSYIYNTSVYPFIRDTIIPPPVAP